ncbi:MAG: hypothetical protein H7124_03895 [Phycisphaerales bacterium]|nr:hypothetical protein [Hyphomonadaceae bacterium]
MKRFTIVCRLLVTSVPHVLGYADSPGEAVTMARKFTQEGKRDVRIGDGQVEKHFDTESFAKEYGVR